MGLKGKSHPPVSHPPYPSICISLLNMVRSPLYLERGVRMDVPSVIIAAGVLVVGIPMVLYGLKVGMTPTDDPNSDLELTVERNVRVLAEFARRSQTTEQIIYGTRRYSRL